MTYHNAGQSKPIQNWMTPLKIFSALDAEFGFGLDLFADSENALKPDFFSKERSAFDIEWLSPYPAFGNPEYGHGFVPQAIERALDQVRVKKNLPAVVLLLPLTTPKWFSVAMRHCEVQIFEGRISFERPGPIEATRKKSGSNFSNCLVIVRPEEANFRGVSALRCSKTGVVTHDYRAEPEES